MSIFGRKTKQIKLMLISYFLFGDSSLIYKEAFCKFSKKTYWLLRALWFFENENFAGCKMAENTIYYWVLKLCLISRNVSLFENCKKVLNHSTLLYRSGKEGKRLISSWKDDSWDLRDYYGHQHKLFTGLGIHSFAQRSFAHLLISL